MKYSIQEISDKDGLRSISTSSVPFDTLKSVYGNELKYFQLLDKGGNPVAQFAVYSFNKLWQKHIITPPFLTDIQLNSNCSANNESQVTNFHRDVLSTIATYFNERQHTYLELVLPNSVKDALPFIWNNYKVGVRHTYLLELQKTEEELLKNMSSQRRKNIRDAEKLNLEVKLINDGNMIREKALETLSSKNAKFNEDIVSNFCNLAGSDQLLSLGVFEDNELIALSTCLATPEEVTYLFGWNNGSSGRSFIGTYALWNCILECKKTSKKFNFAGSQIPSIEKYFRGFGGQITPLISVISDKRKLTKQFT